MGYCRCSYAHLDVHVTVKKELLTKGNRKLKFKKFLKEYHYEDWYLSNIVPTPMMRELIVSITTTTGTCPTLCPHR